MRVGRRQTGQDNAAGTTLLVGGRTGLVLMMHTVAVWPWREDEWAIWTTIAVVAVVFTLCCCGGLAAMIAPDEIAALSPFNW